MRVFVLKARFGLVEREAKRQTISFREPPVLTMNPTRVPSKNKTVSCGGFVSVNSGPMSG